MTAPTDTPAVHIHFLSRQDITKLEIGDGEILDAIEQSLVMQGEGRTVIGERTHLHPDAGVEGHFNVLRGWLGGDIGQAGVKVVGDFYDNYHENRPSEYGLLALFDPRTGAARAVLDASGITDMRTGAVTALGGKYLAPRGAKILGHIGARGSSYWNVRLLDRLFDFEEIRVHSRRPESREAFGARLREDLGKPVIVTADWQNCLAGADIIVEASRLAEPQPFLKTKWVKKRGTGYALRNQERTGGRFTGCHGQDFGRRLGTGSSRKARGAALPCGFGAAFGDDSLW